MLEHLVPGFQTNMAGRAGLLGFPLQVKIYDWIVNLTGHGRIYEDDNGKLHSKADNNLSLRKAQKLASEHFNCSLSQIRGAYEFVEKMTPDRYILDFLEPGDPVPKPFHHQGSPDWNKDTKRRK